MVTDVPDAGDIVWVDFTPQSGREQAGKRPALVLSPRSYNDKTGLMIACPITSRATGYVFEVLLPGGLPVSGVVLSDHVKSLDWKSRGANVVGQAPKEIVKDVLAKIKALLYISQ